MTKPIFVIATAENCQFCQIFAQAWPEIKVAIEASGLVTVRYIQVPDSFNPPDPSQYPFDLTERWIGWYPSFMLFNGQSWENARPEVDHRRLVKLQGFVFNGEFGPDGKIFNTKKKVPTKENLLSWIREHTPLLIEQSSAGILSMLASYSQPMEQAITPEDLQTTCSFRIVPKRIK